MSAGTDTLEPTLRDAKAAVKFAPARWGMAQEQLASYFEEKFGDKEFTATIEASDNESALQSNLSCAVSALMTADEYAALKVNLEKELAAHPALEGHQPQVACVRDEHGHVCVKATMVGLNARDYLDLIHALSQKQHDHDLHETLTGEPHQDAHYEHDKMVVATDKLQKIAAANLQSMAMKDFDSNQKAKPAFTVSVHQCEGARPGTVGMDIRVHGFTDRAQAYPVMGALARAFRKKRRNSMGIEQHDDHLEQHMFHLHLDGLSVKKFGEILGNLCHDPVLQISGGSVHMGRVDAQLLQLPMGSN